MNPFFVYLIKSSVSLAVLYCVFRFTTRNDIHHVLNRFLLVGILFASAIIPFLNVQFAYEEAPLRQVDAFRELVSTLYIPEPVIDESIQPLSESSRPPINFWLLSYLTVIAILTMRLALSIFSVLQLIITAEIRYIRKIILAIIKDHIQPFAFLNIIVLSENDYSENKNIVIAHEYAHIKQLHAIDLMICELFTLLHFFNPFMWLLRNDLILIHEYQADQAVLKKGIDTKKYQLLVLEKAVGERRFAMANHFTHKHIKKRLKMMTQKNKKRWTSIKLVLFVPIMILLLLAFSKPDLIKSPSEFISVFSQDDQKGKWLDNWNIDNIRHGSFQSKSVVPPMELGTLSNVLSIGVNRKNELWIDYKYPNNNDVKRIVKSFLKGENRIWKMQVGSEEKEIPTVGKMQVSKGIIYFWSELEASNEDEDINKVLRSIGKAYLDIRIEKAKELFGKDYFELVLEQQEAINLSVPILFSFLPPMTAPPPPPPPLIVNLHKDKISVDDVLIRHTYEDAGLTEISEKAEDFWKRLKGIWGGRYTAYIYIDEGVSSEQMNSIVDVLQKSGMKDYKVRDVN